jgi:hypothetical protein
MAYKGTGDSGKSTVIKQMQIRRGGFGSDLTQYKCFINLNLIQGLCFCIDFLRRQGTSLSTPEHEVSPGLNSKRTFQIRVIEGSFLLKQGYCEQDITS